MSEGKFDHFSDQGHLFSTASNIVITNLIEFFLIFSVDWFSFCEKHCVWSDNTELFWLSSYNFKLHWFKVSSYYKKISFFDWSVSIFKVRNQISFSQITSNSLNCVLNWKNVNFSKVWDLSSRSDLNNITQSDSEIFSHCFVHSNFSFFKFIINQCNNKSLFSLFSFN